MRHDEVTTPAGTTTPELHPDLTRFAGFVGTWRGRGDGHYPTIDDFSYTEEITFTHVGKPFLHYTQKTRHADTGQPLHTETGYLRPGGGPDRAELMIAQPTGITEVDEGSFDGRVLDVRTDAPGLAGTAKQVKAVRRRFVLDGDTLAYDLWMAHADTPETHHLHAEFTRA